MTDQPAHMWTYWRDKKGVEKALTEYYPAALSSNADLRTGLDFIRAGTAMIDKAMQEIEHSQSDSAIVPRGTLEAARNRRDIADAVTNWMPADKKSPE